MMASRRVLLPDGRQALIVEPVQPPRPARLLDHEAGGFQQPQVARDCRPADRQGSREVTHRPAFG